MRRYKESNIEYRRLIESSPTSKEVENSSADKCTTGSKKIIRKLFSFDKMKCDKVKSANKSECNPPTNDDEPLIQL